jgi:hypothetical protein
MPHAGIVIYPMAPVPARPVPDAAAGGPGVPYLVVRFTVSRNCTSRKVWRQKPHNENDIDRIRSRTPEIPAARRRCIRLRVGAARREIAVADHLGSLTDH